MNTDDDDDIEAFDVEFFAKVAKAVDAQDNEEVLRLLNSASSDQLQYLVDHGDTISNIAWNVGNKRGFGMATPWRSFDLGYKE